MLDMGFIPDIEEICTKLPKQRQTLLFSATMPPPIKKLADKFLDNPKTIEVARPASTNLNITQWLVPVTVAVGQARRAAPTAAPGRRDHRDHLLQPQDDGARAQQEPASSAGFRSGEIHGDMDQPQRIAELDRFKAGEVNILVASDVAARGLDIKGVSHVFNYRRAVASRRLRPPHRPHRPRRRDRHRLHVRRRPTMPRTSRTSRS